MSNDNTNYSIAGRYRTVRKNLDNLGYKQSVSLDSLPLIELLLVDLAQTKETLRHFQSIAKDNLEACSQLQLAVDPYKCDNAKLVQECNQLHQELIEAKEENQRLTIDFKKQIRKLESELSDQQLSFSANLERIKLLELESANKSKKILELQGKCCKPIVNNINLATKKRSSYPLRKPLLEAEPLPRTTSTTTITTASTSTTSFSSKTVEPCIIDFVSMADHRISCLSNEISELKQELFLNNEHIETLKSQLNSRDKEISRLRILLEGGRPCFSINKDHCCLRPDILNDQKRNSNDDFLNLQKSKLNLEQQLKEALKKQHDAMAQAMQLAERNEQLENELKDVDRMALAVEADCNSTVKQSNKRVCKLQEKLEDLMTQVHVLENELTIQRRETQELRADLEATKFEKLNVQRTLECTLEEKKQMTDRINHLTIMASKSPNKVATYHEKRSESRKSSNSKECSCQREINDETPQYNIEKCIYENNEIIESLQNTIERLETERDHYKSECMKYKEQLKKDTEKDNDGMWSQICELRAQMSEKEHTISKLLRDKKELCHEKFNLENKLHNYQGQQKRSMSPCNYCQCTRSPLNDRKSITSSNKIERLERERDVAVADVARLIEERDALRERLKLATETHCSERRRITENLSDTQSRLEKIERKWRDLLLVQGSRRAAMNGLDDQLEDVKEDLRRTKSELTEQRTQYFQLRTLQDQTDQALSDVQGQLVHCENELSDALDRNKSMERQHLQLDNQIKDLKQEINTHRSKVAQLDREKDQLLMDLDEKTEKIASLEREIDFKEQQANGMEQQMEEITHTKEICIDQAADMERQLRTTQLDMEALRRDLMSVTCERETAIQQNRTLQDDLAAVSCEVMNMHKELEASKLEARDLKRQLQTYVCEVRRTEDLLTQKENERTEMLNHFRSLSLEASVLENNNHSLESEAAEVRGALQATRDQIADLERQLSNKDCLIHGYEDQITELSQNVASLEMQLQQAVDERQRAEDDLRTARDLCMTLEQQKECLGQRLSETTELKIQYEMQVARYKSEQDVFQDQLNRDHTTIDRLEKILEDTRKETMESQTTGRELQCEIARLKQKNSELHTKLCTETAEVRKYQTQAAEYNRQICELRREITNERFQRAKLQESKESPLLACCKSESRKIKENNLPTQASRRKCCQCSKSDDGCKQQSHRCSKTDFSKSRGPSATRRRNDGFPSDRRTNEIKVTKRKTPPSSDGVYPTTGEKSGSGINQNNELAKSDKEKELLAQNTDALRKNSLSVAKQVDLYIKEKSCCDNSKNINNSNVGRDISKNATECKNKEAANDLEMKNFSNNCDASSVSFNYANCGCQRKLEPNSQSPCWIIQTLNLIGKILEQTEKETNKNSANTQNAEIEATGVLTITEDKSHKCCEEENAIESSGSNCDQDQRNESGIYTGASVSTCSTQTDNDNPVNSNISDPKLLQILAEIQLYAQNINDYFRLIKSESKCDQTAAQNRESQRKIPDPSTTRDDLLYLDSDSNSDSSQSSDSHSNSLIDASLPTERLSLQSLSQLVDNHEVETSTPRTSTNDDSSNAAVKNSGIPIMVLRPGDKKNDRKCRMLSVNFELPKSNVNCNDDEQLDFNDMTDETVYKCLPTKWTDRLRNRFKSNKDKPHGLLCTRQTFDIQSIDQKIESLRNEILRDKREAEDKSQLEHLGNKKEK